MATALLAAGCTGGSAPATSSPRVLASSLRLPAACGVVLASRAGQVLGPQSAGLDGVPVGQASFDIGSAAKSITAAAVMLLLQHGRIALAAPISRYLRAVPAADRGITIAQLLTHTSGLPQNFSSDQRVLTRDRAERLILALRHGPAGRFSYSNAGYTLLADIVERMSHEPFRRYVADHLLAPAGMASTGWYGEPAPATHPVHGHVGGQDTGPAGTQAPASWATLGAGGMTSTAADMLRWLVAMSSSAIVSPRVSRAMFTPRVPLGPSGAFAAYGWVVARSPSGPIVLIGGDTDFGFTSDLSFLRDKKTLTVALSCSDAVPARDLGGQLRRVA